MTKLKIGLVGVSREGTVSEGRILSVAGPIVDVVFESTKDMPAIECVINATNYTGKKIMLQVAEHAITDADLSQVDRLRTGVFVGIELDLNTTNYHLRWAVRSRAADWAHRLGRPSHGDEFDRWVGELCDSLTPALNANRTIGGLGSIAASRIAREFGLGGPSYVISSEETSGLSALYAASRALQQGRSLRVRTTQVNELSSAMEGHPHLLSPLSGVWLRHSFTKLVDRSARSGSAGSPHRPPHGS